MRRRPLALQAGGNPFSAGLRRVFAEDFSLLVRGPRQFRRVSDNRTSPKPALLQ